MIKVFKLNGIFNFIYISAVLAGYLMTSASMAAIVEYTAGVELEYSDNPTLASVDENDDLRRSVLAGISVEENTSRISADISSLVEYKTYRDGTYADEDWFYLNGDVVWTIRPSSFFWVFEDYYSQQELDPLLPATPNNLINTNVFSTGPDFYFRLDSSHRLHLGMRADDYRFDGTTSDSQRGTVRLAWLYALNSSTEFSMNAEYSSARFEEIEESDFDRQDFFFRVEAQQSRSNYQVDLGGSRIDRAVGEDIDGFLARLVWRNQFRPQSYFLLDASSQYTDSGADLLAAGSQASELDRVGEQISGDIFYDRRVDATYHLGSSSSSYELQLHYRDEDYEILLRDRRTDGLTLVNNYTYSTTVTMSGRLQYRKYDYLDTGQIDRERTGSLSINYRLARNFTLRAEYNLNTQESNIPASEYDENRILVSFFYGEDPGSYR